MAEIVKGYIQSVEKDIENSVRKLTVEVECEDGVVFEEELTMTEYSKFERVYNIRLIKFRGFIVREDITEISGKPINVIRDNLRDNGILCECPLYTVSGDIKVDKDDLAVPLEN